MPEDTMPFLRVRPVKIAAIQVGIVALIKPPGSLGANSTVAGTMVVVAIFSGCHDDKKASHQPYLKQRKIIL